MLTVLFSTYNGSDSLPLMLDSLTKVVSPKSGWKLVAINNNSNDSSIDILESYLNKLPLTILNEAQQGKNASLNRGLSEIEGDLVVLTDDDVVADPMWLYDLYETSKAHTDFDIFSGLILPFWEKEPKKWILEYVNQHIVYALTLPGQKEGEIPPEMALGPNMAVRRHIFDLGFRFDASVGPDGTKLYKMGSETSFMRVLTQSGYRCFYTPLAKVQHIISEVEMDKEMQDIFDSFK